MPFENADPKTALVLSAGGLFGAYQVGAWKHLSKMYKPDMVIGASIGALNGWQIACGASATEMEQLWLDPGMRRLIQVRPRPSLLRGYFEPAPLLAEIRKRFDGMRPEVPFWLVVVEVPTFRTRLIPAAEVTPEHLLATCSMYLFYPTVPIAGRHYTDGGLFGQLPLWAAARLGATRLIAIDCMPKVTPWWMQSTLATLRLFGPRARLPVDVRVLSPSEPTGDSRYAMQYDAGRIRRWIELGESDAHRMFPEAEF